MEKELAEQKRKMEAEMRERIVAEERAKLKEEMKQKLKGELERAQKLKAEQDRERERERNRLRQNDWRMQQQQQIGKLIRESEFFWFEYNFVGRHLYSFFYISFNENSSSGAWEKKSLSDKCRRTWFHDLAKLH